MPRGTHPGVASAAIARPDRARVAQLPPPVLFAAPVAPGQPTTNTKQYELPHIHETQAMIDQLCMMSPELPELLMSPELQALVA